jgi:peptide/nickel transport system substrate-binding protein
MRTQWQSEWWQVFFLSAVLGAILALPVRGPAWAAQSDDSQAGKVVPYADVYYANPPHVFSKNDIRRGGTLVSVITGDPPHFDPDLTTSYNTLAVTGLVYSRLVRPKMGQVDPNVPEIEGDLAKSWEVSDDGLRYTFHLRQGVTWQDNPYVDYPEVEGTEFTCEDAKYSLERDGKSATAFLVNSVATMTCDDKYTLTITLKEADPAFFPNLASVYAMIVPKKLVEQEGDLRHALLGTGPFMLKQYEPKTSLIYVANPNYFEKGYPYLDAFKILIVPEEASRIAAFRAGQIQYLNSTLYNPETVDRILKTNPETVVSAYPDISGGFHVAFRLDKKPWNNPDVRRAISMAINRQQINDLVYAGRSPGFSPPGMPWTAVFEKRPSNEDYGPYYEYNPKKAKELLAKAGYPNGLPGTYELLYFGYNRAVTSTVELLQQYLAQIGVKVRLKKPDYGVWINQALKGSYPDLAYMFTVPAGGMAPGNDFTYELLRCGGAKNSWHLCDKELDKLLVAQRQERDPAKRRAILKQIWDRLIDQMYRAYDVSRIFYTCWKPWVRNTHGATGYRWDELDYGSAWTRVIWLDDAAKYE